MGIIQLNLSGKNMKKHTLLSNGFNFLSVRKSYTKKCNFVFLPTLQFYLHMVSGERKQK